jgi:PKD repeat protein
VYSSDGGQNFVTSSTLVGLLPGNYTVLVADANGCTASESVTITGPADPLVVDEIVDDIECPGFVDGAITLNPSGGTAPYQYSFNNGAFSDVNTITDLNPGPVSWAVVDANGCLIADFVIISDPNNPIQISQMLINDPLCQGDTNGTVTVIAFGGAGGYSFSLDGQTFQSDNFLVGYQAGFYNLTIMDANGCTYSEQIELVDPTVVQIAIESIQNTQCSNEINGAVTLSATGGNPTYLYALENGPLQVSNIFNVLSAGTYTVYASDLNGCIDSTEVTIFAEGDSPVPSFNPLVSGEAVQFINTSLFGTSFFWDFGDGSTSTDISPIHTYAAPGDYLVTLTVTNDCGSESITVNVSTVNIGVTEGALADLNLFPNPGDGHMTVTLGSDVNGPVALQVTDLAGRGLYTALLAATGADGRATLDLSHLAKGTYLLTFSNDGSQRTLRAEIR